MKTRSSPRLRAFDYLGCFAYSLTLVTRDRAAHFGSADNVSLCIQELEDALSRHGFRCHAYCFMPDHLHLLVEGLRDTSDLQSFVRDFKQRTGYRFKQQSGFPLWHLSYFDHVLRKEEDLEAVSAYIRGNPVRRGLVGSAEKYPFSGALDSGEDRSEDLSLRFPTRSLVARPGSSTAE